MARELNKVILVGNLSKTEIRYTQTSAVAILLLLQNLGKIRRQGTRRSKWHRIVYFGKLAEIAEQYLDKGSKVYVEANDKKMAR